MWECARAGGGGNAKKWDFAGPEDGDGVAVMVAEVEEEGGLGEGCLSGPEPSDAVVIHERENRCGMGVKWEDGCWAERRRRG